MEENQYESNKKRKLSLEINRIQKLISKKKHLRKVIFLYHYLGLHKKINLKIKSNYKDVVDDRECQIDFNECNGISIFSFFENTNKAEIKITNSLIKFCFFILDKAYPIFIESRNESIALWCNEIILASHKKTIKISINDLHEYHTARQGLPGRDRERFITNIKS